MTIKKHMEIIVEALWDFRKWFDDGSDKSLEIDSALEFFNQDRKMDADKDHDLDFFPITSVCRDDILHAFDYDDHIKNIVKNMTDHEMKNLASKLANDYCEQLFWESLKTIVESTFIKSRRAKDNVE